METCKHIIGVYKITNTNTCRYYIGYSKNIYKRFSTHRSKLIHNTHDNIFLQRAYNLYGKDSFNYEILHKCETIQEAQEKELIYLEDLTIRDKLYNLNYNNSGGDIMSTHPDKEKISQKISATLLKISNKMTKEEKIKKFGQPGDKNGMYGKTHTEEVRKLISECNKGRPGNKEYKPTSEVLQKLSNAAKLKIGEKNPFYGKHHSLETKRKIREKNVGKLAKNSIPITVDNIQYSSITNASKQLNLPTTTVLWRVKSKNKKFINYKYTNISDEIV
jgi:group I intron endonuclease